MINYNYGSAVSYDNLLKKRVMASAGTGLVFFANVSKYVFYQEEEEEFSNRISGDRECEQLNPPHTKQLTRRLQHEQSVVFACW